MVVDLHADRRASNRRMVGIGRWGPPISPCLSKLEERYAKVYGLNSSVSEAVKAKRAIR